MGKGGGRKGGGGRGGSSKKRKNVWDDEPAAGARIGDGDRNSNSNGRAAKHESMMGQWKKQKMAERTKRRAFEGSVADKKQQQREQLLEEKQRLAARAFEEKAARLAAQPKSKSRKKKPADRRRRRKKAKAGSGMDEDTSGSESEEEQQPRRAKGSLFNQFVQTFQPSNGLESDEEEEEEKEEEQYERVLVDADGNEIVEEEEEEENDDEEEEEEGAEQVQEEADDDDGEEEQAAAEEEAEQPQDPYRRRFQLTTFTEQDAKALDAAPRKFATISGGDGKKAGEPAASASVWPSEYIVSLRPGVASAVKEDEDEEEAGLRCIRARLRDAWKQKGADADSLWPRGSVERALFANLLAYRDVLFAAQTLGNTRALRRMSAMHVLNHVLKARDTVTRNNERIRKRSSRDQGQEEQEGGNEEEEDKEYRDQGFCRASVLVLLPLRSAAVAFVQLLMELLPPAVDTFHNKDRFFDEYGTNEDEEEDAGEANGDQKEWQRVFAAGNNDDCFQIGLSLSRRAMRFYSEYHHADIILASPLGLRQQLGDELAELDAGDDLQTKKLSTDVLSSIEVCVVDSASLIAMQNVDHLRAVLRAVNAPPREAPHADFSRLREWNLSFLGAYFRQTVVFAHGVEPLLNALVSKSCRNLSGCLRVARAYDAADGSATISRVVPRVQQVFQRIDADVGAGASLRADDEAELRFAYFKKHVFEPLLDRPRKHVLVFIPSYFDYVRVRNLFNERENRKLLRCLQICEYTPARQVARARTAFFHGRCHVLLVTERFHFYHQYRLRGIHQLVWYAPPAMGEFYPEVLNMLPGATGSTTAGELDHDDEEDEEDEEETGKSSIALFSRLDLFRLQRVVGNKRAERMCRPKAAKPTFLFR